jgi:hypothetical protein
MLWTPKPAANRAFVTVTFVAGNFFYIEPDHRRKKLEPLQTRFEPAAAPPAERVTVTLDIDADILEWLNAQPCNQLLIMCICAIC